MNFQYERDGSFVFSGGERTIAVFEGRVYDLTSGSAIISRVLQLTEDVIVMELTFGTFGEVEVHTLHRGSLSAAQWRGLIVSFSLLYVENPQNGFTRVGGGLADRERIFSKGVSPDRLRM